MFSSRDKSKGLLGRHQGRRSTKHSLYKVSAVLLVLSQSVAMPIYSLIHRHGTTESTLGMPSQCEAGKIGGVGVNMFVLYAFVVDVLTVFIHHHAGNINCSQIETSVTL